MKRILAFLNPWADPMGSGYHLIQSLLALGSGGTWGLGLGQSRQKFFYLPERFTDSIFAIIGEELGLVTTLAITVLFLCFLYRGFKIARAAKHPFLSLLASGITFSIVFQAFLNIGVITGALPCTGIPLPFISFGGSSLVFSMIGVGFLINISSCDPKAQEKARRSSGSIYLGNEVLDMANSGMGETGSGIRENRGAREAKG
jgi:cell division protein FtsW